MLAGLVSLEGSLRGLRRAAILIYLLHLFPGSRNAGLKNYGVVECIEYTGL